MKRLVGAVTVGFVLATGGTASAWWAEGSATGPEPLGIVYVYGDPGETSDLEARNRVPLAGIARERGVTVGPEGVTLHDPTNPVTSVGRGCEQLDANTLRCHGVWYLGPGPVVYLAVTLGDGDDRLRIPVTSDDLYLLGDTGTGNDVISSNARRSGASITLGDGDDRIALRGSEGGAVNAGAGDDVLSLVNLADDNPICAAGADTLLADAGETSADCETMVGVP